jgi:hypothetical protein
MTWLDAIFIIILVLGAVRGLLAGKLVPLLIVFAIWITSIAIAVNFEEQLGSLFGDYDWYPLLAFFIILMVVQAIIYWSGIPVIVLRSIEWRPEKQLNILGGVVISACITAIYCGMIWRILTAIRDEVQKVTEQDIYATPNAFVRLIDDSATQSGFVAFVDWFDPPKGVILGCLMGAALVALAVHARLREERVEEEDEYDSEREDDEYYDRRGRSKTEGL